MYNLPKYMLKSRLQLRLLYILPYLDPSFGGPVSTTLALAKEMVTRKHHVTVLATNLSEGGKSLFQVPKLYPFKIVVVPTLLPLLAWRFRLFFSWEQIWWFWLHHSQFDIVHFQDYYVLTYIVIGLLCKWYHIPFFITPHGSFDFSPARGKVLLKKLYYHLGIGWLSQAANGIHAISEPEKINIKKLLPRGIVIWLPNLVPAISPTSISWKKKLHLSPRSRCIIFLGRLYSLKGVEELVDGFIFFVNATKDKTTHLLLAGPDAGLQSVLELKRVASSISSRIHFTGTVTGRSKAALIRDAICLCLLSKSEGFPTVVVEAASAGVPSLCTQECNVNSLFQTRGAFLTTRDTPSVADALATILRPKVYRQMGKQAKRWYQSMYSPSILALRYEKMYYQLGRRTSSRY
ncbi:MAG TPA: glycosyltransferase [Patescibacteria group bacterium]